MVPAIVSSGFGILNSQLSVGSYAIESHLHIIGGEVGAHSQIKLTSIGDSLVLQRIEREVERSSSDSHQEMINHVSGSAKVKV